MVAATIKPAKWMLSVTSPLPAISQTAPLRPIKTPMMLCVFTFVLNTATAIISVKRGTKAFKIPAKELSICVCAFVNKKAGMPLPKIPTMARGIQCFFASLPILFQTKGTNDSQAKHMRKSATCV